MTIRTILLGFCLLFMFSCTENSRVKNFGGTGREVIPCDKVLVNATWKGDELWLLTRKRTANDTEYNTYYFDEKSSFGVMEGTFILTEKKCN